MILLTNITPINSIKILKIKQNEAHILQPAFVHLKLWTVLWTVSYKGGLKGTRDNESSLNCLQWK